MVRAEYRGQVGLHFVEAKPIAAGRAGKGALMLQDGLLTTVVILLRPNGHLPYLRGGVDYQHLIFVELTLS